MVVGGEDQTLLVGNEERPRNWESVGNTGKLSITGE